MERSGVAGVEGHGKQESLGERHEQAPPVRAAGAGASVTVGADIWTHGSVRY
jgi:hypothetical protein